MTKLNFAALLAGIIMFCIGICNISNPPSEIKCVTAYPLRSTFDGQIWHSDYKDENGNIWGVFEDSRPIVNRPYVLMIEDGEVTDII